MRKAIFGRRFSPLYLIFPVTLTAALLLGRSSYKYAGGASTKRANNTSSTPTASSAGTFLDRIDDFIIDSDRQLFEIVDLDHLSDFQRSWNRIVNLSRDIDAAIVSNEHQEILPNGYVWKKRSVDADAFRSLFRSKILLRLEARSSSSLDSHHRYLNAHYDGRDYLISYIKRVENGRTYYVVLKISLDYVINVLFREQLGSFNLCSASSRLIGKGRVRRAGGANWANSFEREFPTTLYRWHPEMARPSGRRCWPTPSARATTRRSCSSSRGLGVAPCAWWCCFTPSTKRSAPTSSRATSSPTFHTSSRRRSR